MLTSFRTVRSFCVLKSRMQRNEEPFKYDGSDFFFFFCMKKTTEFPLQIIGTPPAVVYSQQHRHCFGTVWPLDLHCARGTNTVLPPWLACCVSVCVGQGSRPIRRKKTLAASIVISECTLKTAYLIRTIEPSPWRHSCRMSRCYADKKPLCEALRGLWTDCPSHRAGGRK